MTSKVHTGDVQPRSRPRRWTTCGLAVAVAALAVSTTASARYYGRYGVSYSYDRSYAPERLSREHRIGAEMDDWLERGNATVTLSPAFEDGIRVAAWAQGGVGADEYEFGIASAIYTFEIPDAARQVKIRVRYEGEGRALDLGDEHAIAARVWLRHTGPQPGPDSEQPMQGDTFVLRSDQRSEVIEVPTRKYVDNSGILELHVVADGANRVDIDYIEVESYSTARETRVVRHHTPGYRFRPWQAYTYHYYYGGPFYLMTDYGYYLHWDFPYGHTTYVGLRSHHRSYLHGSYRARYPRRDTHVHYTRPAASRTRVNRWTGDLDSTRSSYERGRGSARKARRAPAEAVASRRTVTTTLDKYRHAPATTARPTRDLGKYRRSRATTASRYSSGNAPGQRAEYGRTKSRLAPRQQLDARFPEYGATSASRAPRTTTDSRTTKRRVVPSTNSSQSSRTRARAQAAPSRSTRSTSSTKSRRSSTTERRKSTTKKSTSASSSRSSTKSKKSTKSSKSSTSKKDDDDGKKKKTRRR
jgi:hypothetical protein